MERMWYMYHRKKEYKKEDRKKEYSPTIPETEE